VTRSRNSGHRVYTGTGSWPPRPCRLGPGGVGSGENDKGWKQAGVKAMDGSKEVK